MNTPPAAVPAPTEGAPVTEWKVKLPEGAMTCGFCGITVHAPPASTIFSVIPLGAKRQGRVVPYQADPMPLATCEVCLARHREAARVIDAHPAIRHRLGSDNAQHRLSAAFDACTVRGVPIPRGLAKNPDLTVNMMRILLEVGVRSRWVSRLVPIMTGDVDHGWAATSPWSHVTEDERAELRTAYGRVLALRLAQSQPDVPVRCPDPRGCMFCGVGSVTVPATRVALLGGARAAAEFIWTERSAAPSSIGGRSIRGRVDGHLCPSCDEAVTREGNVGVAAMGRSLAGHLERTGRSEAAKWLRSATRLDELGGVVAHAVRGGPASQEPWKHVALAV